MKWGQCILGAVCFSLVVSLLLRVLANISMVKAASLVRHLIRLIIAQISHSCCIRLRALIRSDLFPNTQRSSWFQSPIKQRPKQRTLLKQRLRNARINNNACITSIQLYRNTKSSAVHMSCIACKMLNRFLFCFVIRKWTHTEVFFDALKGNSPPHESLHTYAHTCTCMHTAPASARQKHTMAHRALGLNTKSHHVYYKCALSRLQK